jgi:ribosomal protein S3
MVRAFKIQFLGRITRRDRARISWILYGSVPYSTITSYVEHAIYIGILRNGTCCLRIWLVRPYSLGNYHNVYRYILSEAILEKMLFSRMRPFIYKSDTSMKKRSLIYLYK